MPRKPRTPIRRQDGGTIAEVPWGLRKALETGRSPDPDDPRCHAQWLDILDARFAHRSVQLWRRYGGAILAVWIEEHPGTRPCAWWDHASPLWKREDQSISVRAAYAALDPSSPSGLLSARAPRRKVGGGGTPDSGRFVPRFRFGVPLSWDELDSDDLPIIESEAKFLARHGVLEASERRRLVKADFAKTFTLDQIFLGLGTQPESQ